MQTLTYTTQQPENNDPSEVWFPALAANWAQFDAHVHDGVTSSKLNITAISILTQTISSASWGADLGGGRYRQLIALPIVNGTQLTFDAIVIGLRLTSTGEAIYPAIVKVSATTYYVYTIDNSVGYTALYST